MKAQPVQLLIVLGERLRVAGADAVPFLRRVQQEHPDDARANFELGSALIDTNPADALGFLRAAVAKRPDAGPVRYNLGQALRAVKRYDEAIHEYEYVLGVMPNHKWSLMNIGVCLHHKGELAAAVDWYERALEVDPRDARTRCNRAIALQVLGRLNEAIVELRRAVESDPNVALIHNNLGAALMEARDSEGAIAAYEATLRLEPRHELANLNLGRLRRSAGLLPVAAEHFRVVTEVNPQNHAAHRDLRGVLMRLGQSDRVRADWRESLAQSPLEHEALNGFAELCLFLGSPSDYHQVCGSLLDRFGTTTDPYIAERTARTCLLLPATQSEIRRAAALVDVALNADRSTYADWALPFFHFAKGLAEYRQGRHEAAIEIMNGKASNVLGPAPRLVIALAQSDMGRHEEARSTLAAAVHSFDWRRQNADNLDAWMHHILRREAEAAILPELPEFLAGRYEPRENTERLALQGICQFEGRFAESAQLYAACFAAEPRLAEDLRTGLRYKAASAAALAGRGEGQACRMWREQARQWLTSDARALRLAAQDHRMRPQVLGMLTQWSAAPDLAGLRDAEELARLPEDERALFAALWAEVRDTQQLCQSAD